MIVAHNKIEELKQILTPNTSESFEMQDYSFSPIHSHSFALNNSSDITNPFQATSIMGAISNLSSKDDFPNVSLEPEQLYRETYRQRDGEFQITYDEEIIGCVRSKFFCC